MCGIKFAEYRSCLKCKKQYNRRFNGYPCTPSKDRRCYNSEAFRVIKPLIHYSFACSDCKTQEESKRDIEPVESKCQPLFWDDKTSAWSTNW